MDYHESTRQTCFGVWEGNREEREGKEKRVQPNFGVGVGGLPEMREEGGGGDEEAPDDSRLIK